MRRPINLAQLSPLRRGLVLGFMRGKQKSRREMRAMAQTYDDELVALRDEFHELASAHYRQCYAAAVDEALIERSGRKNAHGRSVGAGVGGFDALTPLWPGR